MARHIIGCGWLLFIVVAEVAIYQKQEMNGALRLPRCYATGQVVGYKDANGTMRLDSVYHTIASFNLTDQNGHTITAGEMNGKITVANFFFATCTSICPGMTGSMLRLQKGFANKPGYNFFPIPLFRKLIRCLP